MIAGGYIFGFATDHPEHLPPPPRPPESAYDNLWMTVCPRCGLRHGKPWHVETDLCKKCQLK